MLSKYSTTKYKKRQKMHFKYRNLSTMNQTTNILVTKKTETSSLKTISKTITRRCIPMVVGLDKMGRSRLVLKEEKSPMDKREDV